MRPRGSLLGYVPWLLRDWARTRLAVPAGIGVGFGGMMLYLMVRANGEAPPAAMVQQMVKQVFGLVVLASGFFTASQLHGEDREKHHHRFLFSKPVNPLAFYLLAAGVHALAFAALAALMGLGWSAVVPLPSLRGLVLATLLASAFLGSLSFLMGTLVARESPLVLLVYVASSVVHAVVKQAGEVLPAWVVRVEPALPPTHRLSTVADALLLHQPVAAADVRVVLLWALGLWIAGALLLRRLPLAR